MSEKALNVFPIEISIIGKDDIIKGELVRTFAPRTVEKILHDLPLKGRITKRENYLTLSINIQMGNEKTIDRAEKGDIAYWPMSDAICIFLGDGEPYGGISIIGKINENLECMMNLRLGTTIKIIQK